METLINDRSYTYTELTKALDNAVKWDALIAEIEDTQMRNGGHYPEDYGYILMKHLNIKKK